MAALSPAAMPDRNTLRALAQAAARGEAPFQSCIVSVGAHTRVRNGKQEPVSAYTRANPDCGEESDGSWIAVQDMEWPPSNRTRGLVDGLLLDELTR